MILGIGVDLVSVERIEKIARDFGDKFARKIFTPYENLKAQEIDGDFSRRAIFYAKRFAAKEAFSKACGLGIGRGLDFVDIEIVNNDLGCPFIKILNGKKDFLLKHFSCDDFSSHLSLSDEMPVAQAFVIIEKN